MRVPAWARSRACWSILVRMLVLRAVLPGLSRRVPLERLVRLLAHPRPTAVPLGQEFALRTARRLWRNSTGPCLQRSLALYSELGRAGAKPRFRCGLARERGEVMGHAWVVVGDRAQLEPTDPASVYGVVMEFDSTGVRSAPTSADAPTSTRRVRARPRPRKQRDADRGMHHN